MRIREWASFRIGVVDVSQIDSGGNEGGVEVELTFEGDSEGVRIVDHAGDGFEGQEEASGVLRVGQGYKSDCHEGTVIALLDADWIRVWVYPLHKI